MFAKKDETNRRIIMGDEKQWQTIKERTQKNALFPQ